MLITEIDIIVNLKTALKKKSKQMIDMLVKEIKLYNHKIEIYFRYIKLSQDIENETLQIYDQTKQITVYKQS